MIAWNWGQWHSIYTIIIVPIAGGIGWFIANSGTFAKIYRAIKLQFHLRSEYRNLKKQITVTQDLLEKEKARAEQAESERDVLLKQFEKLDILPEEITIMRLLAIRGLGITRGRLRIQSGLDRTRCDYHINRLERKFCFIHERRFADTRPPLFELTDSGKSYSIKNDLDKT